ncbi:hypothetical protein TNCV_4040231 [Trichonephila clavipes]|nr:hypothetical protein TNCV_4040231 [Trichonephila clavipes]
MPVVICRFKHHTVDSTIWLGTLEREHPWGGQRSPTSREEARWLFRIHPCLKGTIHLQTSMPSLGFEKGLTDCCAVGPIPRPYGTVVSITNHYSRRHSHSFKCLD